MTRKQITRAPALVVVCVLLVTGISAGCDSGSIASQTPLRAPKQSSTITGGDSVQWNNNVLQFTDSAGNNWRVVRDQQEATQAQFYKNGSYLGRVNYSWAGSQVVGLTFTEASGHWATTDETGDVMNTDAGVYNGGPGCYGDSCIKQTGPTPLLAGGGCGNEWNDLVDSTETAVGAGLVAVVTSEIPVVGEGTAAGFALAAGSAFAHLFGWAVCEI
jgi:hypothetical protein